MLRNRLDRDQARDDKRQWVQDRRARTRHLIELGGLVQKAGLVELLEDDRATLLGALLGLADQLQDGGSRADLMALWRRRGLRAFDADKDDDVQRRSSRVVGKIKRTTRTETTLRDARTELRQAHDPR